ncbi:RDD family protein [Moraxella sp.]|uniref:RDD family protein n=1 Tax=Moraxella sp. TaxID=479 RepID=UPI0026DD3F41|nr:RDD family protein [Moraxella sp.]MDO4895581.1 RDD family protein [Moraxella sp.]
MYQLASSQRRVVAYIIDMAICLFVGVAIVLLLEFFSIKTKTGNGIWLILFILSDSLNGRSIGKRLLKIQVINFKTQKPANIFTCTIRNAINILNLLTIPIVINAILFFCYNRILADFLTGTCVINANNQQKVA